MMGILLTRKEIWAATDEVSGGKPLGDLGLVQLDCDVFPSIARAQLKKVMKYINSESDRAFSYIGEGVHLIQIPESSWQSLKKEAGIKE